MIPKTLSRNNQALILSYAIQWLRRLKCSLGDVLRCLWWLLWLHGRNWKNWRVNESSWALTSLSHVCMSGTGKFFFPRKAFLFYSSTKSYKQSRISFSGYFLVRRVSSGILRNDNNSDRVAKWQQVISSRHWWSFKDCRIVSETFQCIFLFCFGRFSVMISTAG